MQRTTSIKILKLINAYWIWQHGDKHKTLKLIKINMDVKTKCPYCDSEEEFTIESEDLEDDEVYETECDNCWKNYWIKMWTTWNYDDEAIQL